MATHYVDYQNGSDGNAGTSWGAAKKNISAITPSAGDEIRVAKSPDAVSIGSCTVTQDSRDITLPANTIKNIEMFESTTGWNSAAFNIFGPFTWNTENKEGSESINIDVQSGFTTGKFLWKDLGSAQDLSGYENFSLWVRPNQDVAANSLKVRLCSDTNGDTVVDSYTIPFSMEKALWHAVTYRKGSALSSSVRSVSFEVVVDLHASSDVWIVFDNLFAHNDLGLQSVIGKNDGIWYPILSINGTTLRIGNGCSEHADSTGAGYAGSSETTTLYARDTIPITGTLPTSNYGDIWTTQADGAWGNRISITGGWNTSSGLQDGESWFCAINKQGELIGPNHDHYYVQNIGMLFGYVFGSYGANDWYLDTIYSIGVQEGPIDGYRGAHLTYEDCVVVKSQSYLFQPYENTDVLCIRCKFVASNTYALYIYGSDVRMVDCEIRNWNGTYCLYMVGEADLYAENLTIVDSSASKTIFRNEGGKNHIVLMSPTITGPSTIESYYSRFGPQGYMEIRDYGGDTSDHRLYSGKGSIFSETTTRHSASGYSWKMVPSQADHALSLHPDRFKFLAQANKQVTITAWVRKDSSYAGMTPRLRVFPGTLDGVAETIDELSVAADTWEQLSVSVTPTETGLLQFCIECDGTAGAVYVDDIDVQEA